jgi:hypothetical protein
MDTWRHRNIKNRRIKSKIVAEHPVHKEYEENKEPKPSAIADAIAIRAAQESPKTA